MAKPRVFVSSTYYDLKHIRASLDNFIQSLGYEPILSEKGNIAYTPDVPLDESCYREVDTADIFVLIIGGRYGSEKSEGRGELQKNFFERYDSITKMEYRQAIDQDIPAYVLIESSVYTEYQTYSKNRDNEEIEYVHVDSVNIFHLIEEILGLRRNNPMHAFERYSEIEEWLGEQWSGLFRELLNRASNERQFSSLSSQISQLSEINQTLKTYLENLMSTVSPDKSAGVIESESLRLEESRIQSKLESNFFIEFLKVMGN